MSFLPPVVMEIRANAAQFLSTQEKVAASAKTTAAATVAATQKAAAASRAASAEAAVAADKRIAADARAAEASRKAHDMQASSMGVMTQKQQAAYDKQATAAKQAANAAELAASKEVTAKAKASAAADAYAQAQAKAEEAAKRANSTFGKLAQSAQDHSQAWSTAGATLLGFGTAALVGVGMAVKSFADFDKQMSSVEAATHAAGSELSQLREAAIVAGADTSFSAKEAAQGIEELSKAGVKTKDVLSGGLAGSLNLAAAGSLGVAESAELAATAMTQFKLSGDKIPHLADLLAAGAGKAQGSVSDLGQALKQGGLVAASTGLSIEETTGGLAAFAKAGLIGSDAGTSFKTMLMALTPNSVAAATEMEKLGINAYNAQGEFIGLSGFAGNLKESMKTLSDEQRNASMKIIFGSDAVRAANILYENGAEGIAEWTKQVNDSGYAAQTASMKQNNLAGDIEKLGGSMDSVFLKSGSGANDVLRGIVQSTEDLIDSIGQIPTPTLNASLGLAGVAGGAALVVGGFLTLAPKVMDGVAAFKELNTKSDGSSRGLGKVAKAAGAATVALMAMQVAAAMFTEKEVTDAEEFGQAILKVSKAANSLDSTGLDQAFSDWDKVFGEERIGDINSFADAVKFASNPNDYEKFAKNFDGLNKVLGANVSPLGEVEERLKGLGDQMGSLARNGGTEAAAKSFNTLSREFEKNGKNAQDALDALPGYESALKGLATTAGVTLKPHELLVLASGRIPKVMQEAAASTEGFTDAVGKVHPISPELQESLEDAGVSAEGLATDLEKVLDGMLASGLATLNTRDATVKFNQSTEEARTALADLVKSNGDVSTSLNATGTDFNLTTESGQTLNAKFQDVMRSGIDLAQSVTGTGVDAQKQVQSAMQGTYDQMILAADGMGITGDKAIALTREVLKIPPGVDIKTWIDDYAKGRADALKGTLDGLDGRQISVGMTLTQFIEQKGSYVTEADLNGDTYRPGGSLKVPGLTGGYTGGAVASIMGMYDGGVIPGNPPSRPNVDNILALVNGKPLKVRSGEFLTNEKQTKANLPWLKAMNAGLNMNDVISSPMAGAPTAGHAGSSGPSVTSSVINNHISVQTNASAQHIAGEIGWELRTK